MKIGLLNLEPKYKNLAIEKLRTYHSRQGDTVEDYFALAPYDKIYASSIFTFTKKTILPLQAIYGGSGFNLTTVLPPEIDKIKPHLNFGFTTRGCIRHCPFCIVPAKEGNMKVEGDLYDLWDKKARLITLFDNNILAIPQHFEYICLQSLAMRVKLDFNQGLDHRLLTPDIVTLLKSISHKEYHFAFDHPSYIHSVERAISLLQSKGIHRCNWYVLVGFNTTFEEDLWRLNYLKNHNQIAFVQRYRSKDKKLEREYVALARWANQHHIFRGMTWEQFIAHPENRSYCYLFASDGNRKGRVK